MPSALPHSLEWSKFYLFFFFCYPMTFSRPASPSAKISLFNDELDLAPVGKQFKIVSVSSFPSTVFENLFDKKKKKKIHRSLTPDEIFSPKFFFFLFFSSFFFLTRVAGKKIVKTNFPCCQWRTLNLHFYYVFFVDSRIFLGEKCLSMKGSLKKSFRFED